ncbi:uncharacterized protein LOC116413396 [Galleria mellonella]|uniref:Uncharacterized protein LOC116413396 n=1 Tax=Galleria mellonella TaxID=7137 RepID=A0ABM3MRP3_GALME|nr:uncharacterized protein LOC116413396 [Galleria mellonella]
MNKCSSFLLNDVKGLSDVSLIAGQTPNSWTDMGTLESAQEEGPTVVKSNGAAQEEATPKSHFGVLHIGSLNMKSKSCYDKCLELTFVMLGVVTIFKCFGVIVVTISTAIATKLYSSQQSGRLVAMITVAVTAAIALSVVIYAIVGVFRKYKKPLHATTIVLTILAILQAIISGVSVMVTTEDEQVLDGSLSESFQLAMEDNPKHMKLWDTTHHDLKCCGLYGAQDYRTVQASFLPPEVPISCCPTYDPTRSELVQEREREICKARRSYYTTGCRQPVLDMFRETSTVVLIVVVILIVLEIILAILGGMLYKKQKERSRRNADNIEEPAPNT